MSAAEAPLMDLVAEQFGLDRDKVLLDSTLESMVVDSLESVDLILAIESRFSIHIPDEETPSLDTPRKMLAYMDAHSA